MKSRKGKEQCVERIHGVAKMFVVMQRKVFGADGRLQRIELIGKGRQRKGIIKLQIGHPFFVLLLLYAKAKKKSPIPKGIGLIFISGGKRPPKRNIF